MSLPIKLLQDFLKSQFNTFYILLMELKILILI